MFVGNGGSGTLDVGSGSTLNSNTLSVGAGNSSGSGVVTIIGTGVSGSPQTVVNLLGPPDASTTNNPLELGQLGTGVMTVSNGAIINGLNAGNPAFCAPSRCNIFIGQTAGSSGTLTLQGAGTTASFGGGFFVGNAAVAPGFGTSGGLATGIVNVQSGAVLNTYGAWLGNIFVQGTPNGETASAQVTIDGTDSKWSVTQDPVNGSQARINMAATPNATATLNVSGGGQVNVTGGTITSYIGVGDGGSATLNIAERGSGHRRGHGPRQPDDGRGHGHRRRRFVHAGGREQPHGRQSGHRRATR